MAVPIEIFGWTFGLVPIGVVGLVFVLVGVFVVWYWIPSWRIKRSLRRTLRAIQRLNRSGPILPDEIGKIMHAEDRLRNLWVEYAETLHPQYDLKEGEKRLVAVRATVPAGVFFSHQALVDIPLNTEFFRHLPGILTGIGIIGTFLGLIMGLRGFDPTGSAEAVKESLGHLMHGVMEAFIASACAIFWAMFITFLEKSFLNHRYKQAEELAQAIDGLYQAGVGEEYLARLVDSSERNAVHVAQLKQSLVEDLRQILTELSQRQGIQVSNAIRESLQEPLSQIATTVQVAAGQQGSAVQALLQDLLAAFLARLDSIIGNQLQALSAAWTQTSEFLSQVSGEMDKLMAKIAETGKQNAEVLTRQVSELLKQAETRQETLVQRMEAVCNATDGTIKRMCEGAQTMHAAASEFSVAGEVVQTVLDELNTASAGLRVVVQELQPAVEQMRAAQDRLGQTTQTLAAITQALERIVEQAKREASLSSQLVGRLEQAASQLASATQESSEYLERINGVLQGAFESFGKNLITEINKTQAEFNSQLDKGVRILQAAFEELQAFIDNKPADH